MTEGNVTAAAVAAVAPATEPAGFRTSDLRACYRAASRARSGGFLYSTVVSDRLGSCVAAVALRFDVHPSILTLVNFSLGVAGSAAVTVGAGRAHPNWLVCLGVALWQLAYVFDCSDGQVARASGKTTPSGAQLDPLVDLAVQCSIVAALATVVEHWSHTSVALLALFAGTWTINLFTFLAKKASPRGLSSPLRSPSWMPDAVKLTRDYGFLILVVGVWAAAAPSTLVVPVLTALVVNLVILVSHIALLGVTSIYGGQQPPEIGRHARAASGVQVTPVESGAPGPPTVNGQGGR